MDAKTLALYLGCKIKHNSGGKMTYTLVGITTLPSNYGEVDLKDEMGNNCRDYIKNIKLLLRPLSSMTEEEATQWLRMENNSDVFFKTDEWYSQLNDARKTSWLLSKGFDLFGLLESGDAIDSTKI